MNTCDKCNKDFDIFNEGKAHALFIVCGMCWTLELRARNYAGAR